jgi:hypothetical protein
MPTAGWASETNVLLTQNRASVPAPAAGPATTITASTTKLRGRPHAIRRSVWKPLRCSQGLTMPQHQKASSMQRLIVKSPPAAASGS